MKQGRSFLLVGKRPRPVLTFYSIQWILTGSWLFAASHAEVKLPRHTSAGARAGGCGGRNWTRVARTGGSGKVQAGKRQEASVQKGRQQKGVSLP